MPNVEAHFFIAKLWERRTLRADFHEVLECQGKLAPKDDQSNFLSPRIVNEYFTVPSVRKSRIK